MAVTVLIVDDHEAFRTAARRLLETGGLQVIGEAGDIASARTAIRALRPQVVLLDVQLPDGDGIAAADAICDETRDSDVVLVSTRDEAAYGCRVSASAARGFILKTDLTAARVLSIVGG